MKLYGLIIILSLCALLSACAGKATFSENQYWQRSNTSQAVMMRGKKAEQLLHRDISDCINELRELERLHETNNAVPILPNAHLQPQDPLSLEGGGAALITNNQEYNNFDGCMYAKGWERTIHVPFQGQKKKHSRAKQDPPSSIWDKLFR